MTTEQQQQDGLRFVVGSGLNLVLGVALVFAAFLRETQIFWRNEGGFPVWLRSAVSLLFYPGLGILGLGTSLATWQLLCRFARTPALRFALLAVAAQWLLVVAVVLIASWNNLDNLISGVPLHHHSP